MIYIKKLRVRPKKAQPYNSQAACKEAAETLFHCMRTTPMAKKQHKPTINYHLARLKKIQ
ncbi:NYN domain-containing protein [Favolaschia claudopus]|uniref:NYN domain-containing protein n=1 Tax=Favolaschia claudopus TaxID=2862362 RepID=A0AAW0BD64_9AGAR